MVLSIYFWLFLKLHKVECVHLNRICSLFTKIHEKYTASRIWLTIFNRQCCEDSYNL